MKKLLLIPFLISALLISSSFFENAYSQFIPPNPTIPAASIGMQSLEISNDLYNGKINISIPIYQYSFEGISFPISLNYSAGNGLRTDELPGWVGSGWNLSSSGFIHRTVRGKPDEVLDFETNILDYQDGPGIPDDQIKTYLKGDFSYFTNLNKLNVPNWYTAVYASTLGSSNINLPYTVYTNDHSETHYNAAPVYDLYPDEFSFSFGNVSGKFYLNHLNKWIVVSGDGKEYEINFVTGEQVAVDFTTIGGRILYKAPRIIKYFTMTSDDGIKYYFGNTDINAPLSSQYFDYSHASVVTQLASGPLHPYLNGVSGNTAATLIDIVPHTWHLTKIENLKTSSVITFTYKQDGLQVSKTNQAWGTGGTGTTGGQIVFQNTGVYMNNPDVPGGYLGLSPFAKVITPNWTLTSINFPNNTSISFGSTRSTQLSTNLNVEYDDFCGFGIYPEMYYNHDLGHSNYTLMKLDKISITNNSNIVKEIEFGYNLSGSQRLQLSTLKEVRNNDFNNEHKFYYKNTVALPPYGSRKRDHWGYFNNSDFFASPKPQYNFADLSNYTNSRNSNSLYANAEILEKIVYPTGGEARFEFEPHNYSKKKNPIDFAIINMNSNIETGGVRIKKVSYYTESDQLGYEKNYEYSIPGSNLVSSGFLSQPPRSYLMGESELFYFEAEGFAAVFSEGNHVTYTNVTEKQTGNGKIENTYSNYDNGYNDLIPIETNITGSGIIPYAYSNKSFKRGKLLKSKIINETGTTLRESLYQYVHSESETNKDELRQLYLDNLSTASNPSYTSVSNKIYNDRLIETTTNEFTPAGNSSMSSTITYDLFGNVKEKKYLDSKNNIIRDRYKYAYEYLQQGTDEASLGIANLISKKCKSYLIEEVQTKEDVNGIKVTGGTVYTYTSSSPFVNKIFKLALANPIPYSTFTWSNIVGTNFNKDPNYFLQPEKTIQYNSTGKILQYSDKSNINNSYLLGYNNQYTIAKIHNAAILDVDVFTPITSNFVNNQIISASQLQPVGSFNINYPQTLSLVGTVTKVSGKSSMIQTFRIIVKNTASNIEVFSKDYFPTSSINEIVNLASAGNYSVSYVFVIGDTGDPNETPVLSLTLTGNYSSKLIRHNLFHTSFEEDNSSVSTLEFVTGKKSHTGTFNLTLPGSNGNYILTYWEKATSTANIWVLKQEVVTINNSSSPDKIIGSTDSYIDEVRLYPEGAYMTTYTYEPLIGMTGETDLNNKHTYYEYDSFNRLSLIRDDDNNILKKYCYNYAGQPVDCIPTNRPNIFVKVSYENTYQQYGQIYGNAVARFYSNEACTAPLSVSNLPLKYSYYTPPCPEEIGGIGNVGTDVVVNGQSVNLYNNVLLQFNGSREYYFEGNYYSEELQCATSFYIINSNAYNIVR